MVDIRRLPDLARPANYAALLHGQGCGDETCPHVKMAMAGASGRLMRLHAGHSGGLVLQTRNDALSLDSGEER
jgi:hypothetical protein